jgi:hypothetical protein
MNTIVMFIQEQINEFLRDKLYAASCIGGRLECQVTSGTLLTLRGQKADGKNIFFWDLEMPLQRLIHQYLTREAPQAAAFAIDIDIEQNNFVYRLTSPAEVKAMEKANALQEKADADQRLQDMKAAIMANNTPYGPALATKVAEALNRGALMNGHRDYCGMGLEKDAKGQYLYGEVWDGGFAPGVRTFADKAGFIQWLAAQSDASMANLQSQDTWVWNNQVINRQRLEAFIQGWPL